MEQRKRLVERLKRAVSNNMSELYGELCYEILYDLPQEIQINLCCFIIDRYLPIFEKRYPNIEWPRNLLGNLNVLLEAIDNDVIEPPEGAHAADSSFVLCFIALKNAYAYRENSGIFTTSCVCAIFSEIYAAAFNAWLSKDPEAIGNLNDLNQSLISPSGNEEMAKVKKEEWSAVIEWFVQNRVEEYPDVTDQDMMRKVLAYWKAGDMSLIVPKARKLIETNRNLVGLSIDDIYTFY